MHARGGAKPRVILALAALAVATHPTLDWLNTYGMRWLMPFDGRWFYGDVLFIVDPWLWLLLGAAVFLARSGSWQSVTGWAILAALASALILGSGAVPPAAKLVWVGGLVIVAAARTFAGRPPAASAAIARGLVAVAVLYIVSMGLAAAAARQRVLDALATRGGLRVERFMVGPVPADPVVRSVVAQTAAAYHLGGFWWLRTPALRVRDSVVRTAADSIVTAASRTPAARAFLGWARFPFAEVEATDSGYTVYFLDARYTRARTSDFGGTAVRLSPTLEPLPY